MFSRIQECNHDVIKFQNLRYTKNYDICSAFEVFYT